MFCSVVYSATLLVEDIAKKRTITNMMKDHTLLVEGIAKKRMVSSMMKDQTLLYWMERK